MPEHGVGTRAVRGMFWAYGSYVGGRALVLVATAVLARLLTPADFGLVALALAALAFLEPVADLGLTQALMLADEKDVLRKADSVWSASVLMALGLSLVISALGPLAAHIYGEPELAAILPVLGLNLFLRSLGQTHYALAQRRLDFRGRTLAEFVDVCVRGVGGIALALAGFGAWSLVIGYLIGTIAMDIALFRIVAWRPHPKLRRADLAGMIGFGGALTGVNVIGALLATGDDLIVGGVLGTTALGLYSIAYRLPDLLIKNMSNVAGQVLFPAMTSLDRGSLPAGLLRSLRYAAMVALPLAVSVGVLAEPLVLVLFGDQWRGAITAMQVMALWTVMTPIDVTIGTAYKSLGRADLLLKLAIPRLLILLPLIALVADHGIVAVAWCQAAVAIAATLVAMVIATRILDVTGRQIWSAVWPAALAAVCLGGVLIPLENAISSPVAALVISFVVAVPTYLGLLWILARDALRSLLRTAFPKRAVAG